MIDSQTRPSMRSTHENRQRQDRSYPRFMAFLLDLHPSRGTSVTTVCGQHKTTVLLVEDRYDDYADFVMLEPV